MFKWKSMGFVLHHEKPSVKVDVETFSEVIDEGKLEQMFNVGLYFYHPVHRISVASLEDYYKYIYNTIK